MAVTTTWNLKGQIEIPAAFIIATPTIVGDKLQDIRVGVWKDEAAYATRLQPLESYVVTPDRLPPDKKAQVETTFWSAMAGGAMPMVAADAWLRSTLPTASPVTESRIERAEKLAAEIETTDTEGTIETTTEGTKTR
jgi:hypothetical protein